MNATHTEPLPTRIEEVVPKNHGPVSRLDAWRWEGVLAFDAYKSLVLAREENRAARNVNV